MFEQISNLWSEQEREQLTLTREFLHLRAKQWEERYVNVLSFLSLWTMNPELYVDLTHRLIGLASDLEPYQKTKRNSRYFLSLEELFSDDKYNEEISRYYQARRAIYSYNYKSSGLKMHDLIRDFGTVKITGDEKFRYSQAMFGGQPKKVVIREVIKKSLDLITRIEELPVDKALDISKMDKFGQGTKLMNIPKTDKGKRKRMRSLPLYSDNYDAFLLALDLLPTINGLTPAAYYQDDMKELKKIFYPQLPEDVSVKEALLPLATEKIPLSQDFIFNQSSLIDDQPQRLTVSEPKTSKLPSLKIEDFEDDINEYNFVGDQPKLKNNELIVNRGQYYDDREYEDADINFNEQDPYDDQNFEDNSPLTAYAEIYHPETISQQNKYTGSHSNAINKALAGADIEI